MADDLKWEAPGRGRWELELAHGRGTVTPFFRDIWADTEREGFQWAGARYGAPISHPEMRFVNGWPYIRIMGAVEGPDPTRRPPAWLLWTLLRLHPELRRRNKQALQIYRDRLWREDVDRWEAEKPTVIAANLALQDEPIETYSDEQLADHLDRAVSHARAGSLLHFKLHGVDIFIPGDFLAHGVSWGLDVADLVALLRGSSPASAETSQHVQAVADAVTAAGIEPSSLDEVRGAGPTAADALDRYLRYHGWRVVTAYDVDALTLHELPQMLLGCIRAAASGSQSVPAPEVDEGELRAKVPESDRPLFDELLADARVTYGVRDDNVGPTYMWPVGLVRRGLLEAGLRLVEHGTVAATEHLFECSPAEVRALLLGSPTAPSAAELVERAATRAWLDSLSPPLELGPEEPDPPLHLLPAGLARTGIAALTYAQLLFGQREDRRALRGAGVGSSSYTGRARVAADAGDAISRLEPGDVLVTAFTTPAYNAVLPVVGALVVEEGGALSHAAIVAREFGIPAVIGAHQATSAIHDGALVEVDPVAGEVRVVSPADRTG